MINNFQIPIWHRPKLRFAFLVMMFIFFSVKNSFACTIAFDPDSTKPKYELNDPRNPDCPCHAAQKLADEEYKKQQEQNTANNDKENNDPANKNKVDPGNENQSNNNNEYKDVNANKNVSGISSGGSAKHYSKSNTGLKQMNKWMKHMKRQLGKKNNGTKKGKRRLASCFHFN